MKLRYTLLLFTIAVLSASAQDTWTQKADFTNIRHYAAAFSIGSTGYIFGDTTIGTTTSYNELWAFNPATNTWIQKASLPGSERHQSGVFVVNGKAYVCGGRVSGSAVDDVWEYNPVNDSWTQKAAFPGGTRRAGFAFSIGTKGYFGSGAAASGTSNDCWEYEPTTDTWTQKANFPSGTDHLMYASFSVGQKGYVVGGLPLSSSSSVLNETWEFDPTANTWTQKANYPHPVGQAAAFALNGEGFVFGGNSTNPVAYYNDLNEYDPASDTWTARASLPADARSGVSAFAVNGKGYAGLGFAANLAGYKDWWEYTPDGCVAPTPTVTVNANQLSTSAGQGSYQWYFNGNIISGATSETYTATQNGDFYVVVTDATGCSGESNVVTVTGVSVETIDVIQSFTVFPNPATSSLTITSTNTIGTIEIVNALGQVVSTHRINNKNDLVDVSELPAGVYQLLIINDYMQTQTFVKH